MTRGTTSAEGDSPYHPTRVLTAIEVLDAFVEGRVTERVRISHDQPLTGEVGHESTGRTFLSPEEDERGEGMGAVRVYGLTEDRALELSGRLVRVAGLYDPSHGLTLESVVVVDPG